MWQWESVVVPCLTRSFCWREDLRGREWGTASRVLSATAHIVHSLSKSLFTGNHSIVDTLTDCHKWHPNHNNSFFSCFLYRLALYVYEYLLHCGAQKAAQTFLSEIRWEKNITLGEPPGFLHSWWWWVILSLYMIVFFSFFTLKQMFAILYSSWNVSLLSRILQLTLFVAFLSTACSGICIARLPKGEIPVNILRKQKLFMTT